MALFGGRRARIVQEVTAAVEKRYMDAWFNIDPDVPYGRLIDEERAVRLSYVYSAWRFLADYISTLPLDAYTGGTAMNTLPALFRNLDSPGEVGLVNWLSQCVVGMAAHGQAVGVITATDGMGFATMVRWIQKVQWQYEEAGKQWFIAGEPFPSSRIVHVPWIQLPGKTEALSPIEVQSAVIRSGLSAQEYADVRRGGGVPPVHLKNVDQELTPQQAEEASRRASAKFAQGMPFVTGSDWDLNIPAIPPNQANFIETMKMGATQIAAMYGISPEEIAGESQNSLDYKTEESRELRRASDCRPWIIRIEEALGRILPAPQTIKLNVDATLRTDALTRAQVEDIRIKNRTLTPNEARTLEDLPPVPGGDELWPLPAMPAQPNPDKGLR